MQELELRTLLSDIDYFRIDKYLQKYANKCIQDDLETYFYITNEGNLKIKHHIQTNKAYIVYKTGGIHKEHTEELAVEIKVTDIENMQKILFHLGHTKMIPVSQKRKNFYYKDTEIALKDTTSWGKHIEIEYIGKSVDYTEAKKIILQLFEELKIAPMTEKELEEHVKNMRKKHGF